MRIRLVTVGACIVRKGGFEIGPLVTLLAGDIDVFAEQWELRLRVIKRDLGIRLRPRKRCVTGVAALFECALMRVAMAIGAVRKCQSRVANLPIRSGGVATLAQYVAMLTR